MHIDTAPSARIDLSMKKTNILENSNEPADKILPTSKTGSKIQVWTEYFAEREAKSSSMKTSLLNNVTSKSSTRKEWFRSESSRVDIQEDDVHTGGTENVRGPGAGETILGSDDILCQPVSCGRTKALTGFWSNHVNASNKKQKKDSKGSGLQQESEIGCVNVKEISRRWIEHSSSDSTNLPCSSTPSESPSKQSMILKELKAKPGRIKTILKKWESLSVGRSGSKSEQAPKSTSKSRGLKPDETFNVEQKTVQSQKLGSVNSIHESSSSAKSVTQQLERDSVGMVEDAKTDKPGLGIVGADTSMSRREQIELYAKYDIKGLETSPPQKSSQHKTSGLELTPPLTPKHQKLSPVQRHTLSPVPSKRRSLLGSKANCSQSSIDGRDVTYSDTKVQKISKLQDGITDSELEAMTLVNNSDIETRGLDLGNGLDIPTVSKASLEELHVTATNALELNIAVDDNSYLESQQYDSWKDLEIPSVTNQSLEEVHIQAMDAFDILAPSDNPERRESMNTNSDHINMEFENEENGRDKLLTSVPTDPDETTTGFDRREFEMMSIKIPDADGFNTRFGETIIDNGMTRINLEFGETMNDEKATEKSVMSLSEVTSGSDISIEAMTPMPSKDVKNSKQIGRNKMNERESEVAWNVVGGTEFGICRTEANHKVMGGMDVSEITSRDNMTTPVDLKTCDLESGVATHENGGTSLSPEKETTGLSTETNAGRAETNDESNDTKAESNTIYEVNNETNADINETNFDQHTERNETNAGGNEKRHYINAEKAQSFHTAPPTLDVDPLEVCYENTNASDEISCSDLRNGQNYQELVRKFSEIPLINDANQTVSKVSVETLSYPDNGEYEKKSAVSIVTFDGNTIEPMPGGTDKESKLEAMEKAGLYYICDSTHSIPIKIKKVTIKRETQNISQHQLSYSNLLRREMKDGEMGGIAKWRWSFENEYDGKDDTPKYDRSEESTDAEEESILNFNQSAASDGETRMREESQEPGYFKNTVDVKDGESNDCNLFGELKREKIASEMNPDCAEIHLSHSHTDEATSVCSGGNSLMTTDEAATGAYEIQNNRHYSASATQEKSNSDVDVNDVPKTSGANETSETLDNPEVKELPDGVESNGTHRSRVSITEKILETIDVHDVPLAPEADKISERTDTADTDGELEESATQENRNIPNADDVVRAPDTNAIQEANECHETNKTPEKIPITKAGDVPEAHDTNRIPEKSETTEAKEVIESAGVEQTPEMSNFSAANDVPSEIFNDTIPDYNHSDIENYFPQKISETTDCTHIETNYNNELLKKDAQFKHSNEMTRDGSEITEIIVNELLDGSEMTDYKANQHGASISSENQHETTKSLQVQHEASELSEDQHGTPGTSDEVQHEESRMSEDQHGTTEQPDVQKGIHGSADDYNNFTLTDSILTRNIALHDHFDQIQTDGSEPISINHSDQNCMEQSKQHQQNKSGTAGIDHTYMMLLEVSKQFLDSLGEDLLSCNEHAQIAHSDRILVEPVVDGHIEHVERELCGRTLDNSNTVSVDVLKGIPEKFEDGGKELHETTSPSSYQQLDETPPTCPNDKISDCHNAYVPDIMANISTTVLSNNSPTILNGESADFKFDELVPNEWDSEVRDDYQPNNLTDGNTVNCSFLAKSDDESSQLGVENHDSNLLKISKYSNFEVKSDEASEKVFESESSLASKPESELMFERISEPDDELASVATSQLVCDPAFETDAVLAFKPDARTGVMGDKLLTEVPTNTYDDAVDDEVYLDCCEDDFTWASNAIDEPGHAGPTNITCQETRKGCTEMEHNEQNRVF